MAAASSPSEGTGTTFSKYRARTSREVFFSNKPRLTSQILESAWRKTVVEVAEVLHQKLVWHFLLHETRS